MTEKGNSRLKYVIKASEAFATNHMSLNIGDIILLENSNEPHTLLYGYQAARIVANNMRCIKHQPKNFITHFQTDTATFNQVQNVGNHFIQGLKEQLGIPQSQEIYKNDHDVVFDFRNLQFILSQESMHEFHRLKNENGFRRGYPDSGYMQKDLKSIIHNTRIKYDEIESPYILNEATKKHCEYILPYEIYQHPKCKILFSDKYFPVVSRAIRALWMLKKKQKKNIKKN